jgi:helix-turn-helix protein
MPPTDEPRLENDLMTLAETADHLRTRVAPLRYWRHLGVGPAGFRLGRRVIFRRAEVDRWLSQRQATAGL